MAMIGIEENTLGDAEQENPEAILQVIRDVIAKIKGLEVHGIRGEPYLEIAQIVDKARALEQKGLLLLSPDNTRYLNAMLKASEDISGPPNI